MSEPVPPIPSPDVLARGSDGPLPERVPLYAGPLALVFEAGDLRAIRLGPHEVVRRIYVAVRDRNWDTLPATLSDLQIESGPESFSVRYLAEHRRGEIDFAWRATITGDARGTVTFAMEGEARSTFLRNRIGLCVHHPIRECAGRPCRLEHADGSAEASAFPDAIAPHQPFRALRAMSHEVTPGLWAEVRFSGEVFETEDQRNWTDASFKTYSTPLDLPFPVEVARGTRIAQTVTLSLHGARPPAPAGIALPSRAATLTIEDHPAVPLPEIGLGAASHRRPLRTVEVDRLRALRLAHLRADVFPSHPGHAEALRRTSAEAATVGVPLEVAVFLNEPEPELAALRPTLDAIRPDVRTWWIFDAARRTTPERLARLARAFFAEVAPSARIGGGTDAYFAELNRNRPPIERLDVVGFSLNPQVHAEDLASLVENLDAQRDVVQSAQGLAGGKPVAVGPITLRPRFNPNATGPAPEPPSGELPPEVDPRQMSLFGASWTLGSLANLIPGGPARLTYYETTGWRGVMEEAEGPPISERFRSIPGAVYPLYHILADAGEFAGGEALPAASDAPEIVGLALRRGDRRRLLLANLGATGRRVRVAGLPAGSARVRRMDETNAVEAMRAPEAFRERVEETLKVDSGGVELEVGPFAVVRLDLGAGEAGR